jgi:biopolymer transport protein ExbB
MIRETLLWLHVAALAFFVAPALAQDDAGPAPASEAEAERLAEEALADDDEPVPAAEEETVPAAAAPQLNWGELILTRGGIFMIPIAGISVLVLAFGIERAIALRRQRVIPEGLFQQVLDRALLPTGIDVAAANAVCQQYPSPAAHVVQGALAKAGKAESEIEQAITQVSEREAAKLYANVRHIMLGVSVAPLLGLLGTVQGMIIAFFTNMHLAAGANRAAQLSEGIYTALVTTLAGLCVAIPAALMAHWFEGRIQRYFGEIEEFLAPLVAHLERTEARAPRPGSAAGRPAERELRRGAEEPHAVRAK